MKLGEAGFGGGVGGHANKGTAAGEGADIDDVALASVLHVGDDLAATFDGGDKVDLVDVFDVLGGGILKEGGLVDACVVNPDVDGAVGGDNALDEVFSVFSTAKVAGVGMTVEGGHAFFQGLRVACDANDLGTGGGKDLGAAFAYSA